MTSASSAPSAGTAHQGSLAALSLGAMGVVYGDIGTSPLYTIKEIFSGHHGVALHQANVLGALSLVFWSLVLVVSLKYVLLLLRADNRGEGGQMALMALAMRTAENKPRRALVLTVLAITGTALFYGDGVVTPAISVLSAMEGLEVAAPALHPFVIPLTLIVLVGLFLLQRRGTASMGAMFGPVMMLWFSVLAVLGLMQVVQNPAVLAAVNPGMRCSFVSMKARGRFWRWGRWCWRSLVRRPSMPTWGILVRGRFVRRGLVLCCLRWCSTHRCRIRSSSAWPRLRGCW